MISINNRQSNRHRVHSHALILQPASYFDATVLDISVDGALIEVPGACRIVRGAVCTLRLLSESGRQLLEVETEVVRVAGDHRIGVKTHNLSSGARDALQRLIDTSALGGHHAGHHGIGALLRRVEPARLAGSNAYRAETTSRRSA